jgi:hypothetical protein
MRRFVRNALPVCIAPIVVIVGCQRGVVIREEVIEADEGMVVPGPFAPTVMRIHPLTHTETVEESERIVLHVEIRDGWGDTIKGIGDVQVHLRRSGSSTIGETGTKWDIDLRDFSTNVSYFDSVTRTYRFVLSGMPDWFAHEGRGRIRVLFRTARADGSIEVFQDEFELLSVVDGN